MKELVLQGRTLTPKDTATIEELIATHPGWSRRRLSRQLCAQWNWRNGAGQIKDMAARSLLVKLQARGLIQLPERRQVPSNRMRRQRIPARDWEQLPVECSLQDLGRLELGEVSGDGVRRSLLASGLAQFHYLGYAGTVGENLQYIVSDGQGRLLAFLLFGSSAWKLKARDEFIGWNQKQRQEKLNLTTNNTRFLILPWVKVPHLASWVLGQATRRLGEDWQKKYGHAIFLVESFVERDRFRGIAYRAANWIKVGSTTGRTRQDPDRSMETALKDIYLTHCRRAFGRSFVDEPKGRTFGAAGKRSRRSGGSVLGTAG